MCSISWIVGEGGYELVFNRDEKWSRASSLDYSFETDHRVPGFCARDAQANGTWLFTNEAGLTLALFNAYPGGNLPPPGKQTRGQIPLLAAEAESTKGLVELLRHKDYNDFAPFDLFLLDDSRARCFSWDGLVFRDKEMGALPFLTSSSVHSQRVIAARRKRFEQMRELSLIDLLSDTAAAQPEEAIYVTREDGGTVSQTLVKVSRDTIQFSVTRRGEVQRITSVARRSLLLVNG
jgi:uncharacterized protein with NRDE domain